MNEVNIPNQSVFYPPENPNVLDVYVRGDVGEVGQPVSIIVLPLALGFFHYTLEITLTIIGVRRYMVQAHFVKLP